MRACFIIVGRARRCCWFFRTSRASDLASDLTKVNRLQYAMKLQKSPLECSNLYAKSCKYCDWTRHYALSSLPKAVIAVRGSYCSSCVHNGPLVPPRQTKYTTLPGMSVPLAFALRSDQWPSAFSPKRDVQRAIPNRDLWRSCVMVADIQLRSLELRLCCDTGRTSAKTA